MLGAVLTGAGGFAAVFAVAAAITVCVWVAAYLLIDRPAAIEGAPAALEAAEAGAAD